MHTHEYGTVYVTLLGSDGSTVPADSRTSGEFFYSTARGVVVLLFLSKL